VQLGSLFASNVPNGPPPRAADCGDVRRYLRDGEGESESARRMTVSQEAVGGVHFFTTAHAR